MKPVSQSTKEEDERKKHKIICIVNYLHLEEIYLFLRSELRNSFIFLHQLASESRESHLCMQRRTWARRSKHYPLGNHGHVLQRPGSPQADRLFDGSINTIGNIQ